MLKFIVIALWGASTAVDAAAFAALWQLKEYRWDRMRSFLGARGYWIPAFSFFRFPLRLPARTPRALLLIFLEIGIETAAVFLFPYWIVPVALLFLRWYLFSALVFLSGIPVGILKRRRIRRATEKMRRYPGLIVIGVTGSYGKTSVKTILAHILTGAKRVIATPEHVNTEIGIANFILKTDFANTDVFIVEMGAYRKGEIQMIADTVKPTIGILTAINEQHLALFGSMKNIQTAKYELLRALPKNGLAVVNADNAYAMEFLHELAAPAETFHATGSMEETNIAPCRIVATHLGLSAALIEERVKTLPPTTLRKHAYGRATIIDDSYNSNPAGFRSALNMLDSFAGKKKIVVTRGMIELGGQSDALHEEIGKRMGEVADTLILIDLESESAFRRGIGEKHTELVIKTRPGELTEAVRAYKDTDSIMLIENRIPMMLKLELGL